MTLRSQTTVVGIVPPNINAKKNKVSAPNDTNVLERSMTLRSQTTVVGIVPPNINAKKNKVKKNKAKKNNEKQEVLSEFDKLYQEYRNRYNMPFLRRKVGFFVKLIDGEYVLT
jgi:hypothetical protein